MPFGLPAYRQFWLVVRWPCCPCSVVIPSLQDPDQVVGSSRRVCGVVAGPELYKPWLEQGRYGLFASELSDMVPLARQLVEHPQQRMELVERAHARAHDFQLERLLPWRMALYSHLNRLAQPLERALGRRFPIRQSVQ